jgi:hypothetical protein
MGRHDAATTGIRRRGSKWYAYVRVHQILYTKTFDRSTSRAVIQQWRQRQRDIAPVPTLQKDNETRLMNDFTPIFKALSDATQELIASHAHLVAIGQALTDATAATQHARDEGEDVKVTVHRLEALVQELLDRRHDKP